MKFVVLHLQILPTYFKSGENLTTALLQLGNLKFQFAYWKTSALSTSGPGVFALEPLKNFVLKSYTLQFIIKNELSNV